MGKWWPDANTTQKQKKLFENAKDDVKTALTVCKEGVELGKVMGIIRDSIGCDIDYRGMGFKHFGEYLYHIDDILEVRMLPYETRKFLFLKESALDSNTEHMRRMVQEQANAKTNKKYARPTMKNTRRVSSEALLGGGPRLTQAPSAPAPLKPSYSASRPSYLGSKPSYQSLYSRPYPPPQSPFLSSTSRTSQQPLFPKASTSYPVQSVPNSLKASRPLYAIPKSKLTIPSLRPLLPPPATGKSTIGLASVVTIPKPVTLAHPPVRPQVLATPSVFVNGQDSSLPPPTRVIATPPVLVDKKDSSPPSPIRPRVMANPPVVTGQDSTPPSPIRPRVMANPPVLVNGQDSTPPSPIRPRVMASPPVLVNGKDSTPPSIRPRVMVSTPVSVASSLCRKSSPPSSPAPPTRWSTSPQQPQQQPSSKSCSQAFLTNCCPSSIDLSTNTEMDVDDDFDWISLYKQIWDNETEYPEGEGVRLDWIKNGWHDPAEPIAFVDVPLMKMVEFRLTEYSPSNRFMLTSATSEGETIAFTETMNGYYNIFGSSMAEIPLSHLKSNGIYAGYDEVLETWLRVQVDLREGVKADQVKVFTIDYGTTINIKRTNLRYLALKYASFQRQAFQSDLWIGVNKTPTDSCRAHIDEQLGRNVGELFKVYVAVQLPDYLTGVEFLKTCMMIHRSRASELLNPVS